MRSFPGSPAEMVRSFVRNRQLIVQLSRREVIGRYRGSALGWAWSLVNPLFMLAVYMLVFSGIFTTRWEGAGGERRSEIALILFLGLVVHGFFAECINRAPSLIVNQPNFVKKVVFPLEVIPWVGVVAALFHAAIGLVVLLAGQLLVSHHLPPTALLLPIVILPLLFLLAGMSWLFAGIGVYVRDLSQVAVMFSTAMLFVSAVFFPLTAVPQPYRAWLRFNPLAVVIEQCRETLIFGRVPDPVRWTLTMAFGIGLAWVGFATFQKVRRGFANVL